MNHNKKIRNSLKNSTPKVAVLLASYNGSNYIQKQIASIINQKKINLDLYISDDCSSDSTVNIIKNNHMKNITIFKVPYRFGSSARNFFHLISLIDARKYNFFAFSDQDDIWFEDKVSRAVKVLNSSKASGYSSNFIALWENGKKISFRKDYTQKKFDYMFESAGPGCSYLIKKDLFLEIQSFLKINNKRIIFINAHDWFIYAFARSRGFKWSFDKQKTFYYCQHSSNSVGINFGFNAYFTRLKKLINGDFSKQVWLIASILGYEKLLVELIKDFFSLRLFVFLDCRRRFRDAIFLLIFVFCGMFRKSKRG